MDSHYPPQNVPATPEYVLSVFVDIHRQQSQLDPEADPRAVLTFGTSVEEWRNACDIAAGWKKLGRFLNAFWAIDCSEQQWKSVLHPPRRRTIKDVCELIAAHASRPVIRPMTLLGKACDTAGAFATVRYLLSQAGADDSMIAPSTLLAPFLRQYTRTFLGPISRLAPGKLPLVRIRNSFKKEAWVGFLISLLLTVVDVLVGKTEWAVITSYFAIAFFILIWIAAYFRPSLAELGNLKTFRDLACVLTGRRNNEGQF